MLTLTFLTTLMLSPRLARAQDPECVRALASFKQDQVQAIRGAAVEGHSIRILTKRIGRRTRRVILVGESLLKSPAVARASQHLGRAFPTLAYGGGDRLDDSWFPKAFKAYRTRRLAEEVDAAGAGTEFGSLVTIAAADDKIRAYEDEVVAKLVAKLEAREITSAIVPRLVQSIQLRPGLLTFDHQDVIRRIRRYEVKRPARRLVDLETSYRPTVRHNLSMVFVVASDKLAFLSGRVQKVLSLLGVAGGAAWMVASHGADGKAVMIAAASMLATQFAIDFGREKMTREFAGIGSRTEHMAVALKDFVETNEDDVLTVVPERQSLGLAQWLHAHGFREDAYLPLHENGVIMVLQR